MAVAHTNLAGALTVLAKIETRAQEKAALLSAAETEYKTVLSFSPDNAISHNNLAGLYLDRNQFDLATQHYEASLRSDPNNAAAHFNLAIAFDKQGQKEAAVERYRRALALYPNDMVAYWARVHLARLLGAQGRRSEQVTLLSEAIQINATTRVDPVGNVAQRKLAALGKP